ncbi:MAG: hypothetical protein WBD00_06665 [Candidatus Omnitrophota bacterium]|jgi:hypothetical protein
MIKDAIRFIAKEIIVLAGFIAALYAVLFLISLWLRSSGIELVLNDAVSLEITISWIFVVLYILYLIGRFIVWNVKGG